MRIGILALQGCVEPHKPHIKAMGCTMVPIRSISDCDSIDGYIIPGGESTTMLKLMKVTGLHELLPEIWSRKPVWGICAGAILMAKTVYCPEQYSYNLIDCSIVRNAYGAQIVSEYKSIESYDVGFIRAPRIMEYGGKVQVLASIRDADGNTDPVWLISGNKMLTTFHPELNKLYPSPMHERFMSVVNI